MRIKHKEEVTKKKYLEKKRKKERKGYTWELEEETRIKWKESERNNLRKEMKKESDQKEIERNE